MKKWSKRIAFSVFFLLTVVIASNAQTVGYTAKPLGVDRCTLKYGVAKQDTAYYIIAAISSVKMKFLKESTMMLKTFEGDVIKLEGTLIDNDTQSAGVITAGIIIPVTEITSTAQFEVSPSQFELLNKGISKIRLSTIPVEHERTFNKDKIGKKLYQFFLKQKKKEEDF